MFSTKFVDKVCSLFTCKGIRMICTVPVSKGNPIALVEDLKNRSDVTMFSVMQEPFNEPSFLNSFSISGYN